MFNFGVQEPCVKCLAVHILHFEILGTNKKINQKCPVHIYVDMLERLKTEHLNIFVSFFIRFSRFQILTAKHLMQASCTELALT